MTLLTRVSRLFKADVHGILDALEDPESILKQAVREMEEEIVKTRLQVKKLDKQIERLGSIKKNLTTKQENSEQQIDYAFSENNESLIKSRLRKKLEIIHQIETTENNLLQLNDDKTELEIELKEQNNKLQSIIEKLNLFSGQACFVQDNNTEKFGNSDINNAITQEDVELAFLHEKQRRVEQRAAISDIGETI